MLHLGQFHHPETSLLSMYLKEMSAQIHKYVHKNFLHKNNSKQTKYERSKENKHGIVIQ